MNTEKSDESKISQIINDINEKITDTVEQSLKLTKNKTKQISNWFNDIHKIVTKNTDEVHENQIKNWTKNYIELKNKSEILVKDHIYLSGSDLEHLSNELIQQAKDKIYVVNSFVEKTNLSTKLIEASRRGVNITLITRKPKSQDVKKVLFHNELNKEKIKLLYLEGVHAKIMIIDNEAVIVSSMNLIPTSTGGQSWEAGMISFDKQIINQALKSIISNVEILNT